MNAREAIFASIRRSLAVTGDEATRLFEVEMRLKAAPSGVVPKRGHGDVATRLAIFRAEAERAQATVAEIGGWAGGPAEIPRIPRLRRRHRARYTPRKASSARHRARCVVKRLAPAPVIPAR